MQSPGKTSIREWSHNSFIRSLVVWWCRAREEAQRVAIFPQAALGGREPLPGRPKSHQAPPWALIEVLFHWSWCSFGRTSLICNGLVTAFGLKKSKWALRREWVQVLSGAIGVRASPQLHKAGSAQSKSICCCVHFAQLQKYCTTRPPLRSTSLPGNSFFVKCWEIPFSSDLGSNIWKWCRLSFFKILSKSKYGTFYGIIVVSGWLGQS